MSSTSAAPETCLLLDLPREVRDHILGEVFFPSEKEPKNLRQDIHGLGSTAIRQINPYNMNKSKMPHFDISIIITCRQLQHEAESILYGSSFWNLMYQDWCNTEKLSYEFLEKLPKRLRQLIQRVEQRCYAATYSTAIPLWDWKALMSFLARECPNLHSLRLWGPGNRNEGHYWVETCDRDAEWVQAILQIRSLKHFDIPVIPGGIIYEYPKFKDDFLPWLKTSLVQVHEPQLLDRQTIESNDSEVPFPFMKLDKTIRNRIYRHVLLPPNKRLHPYLKPWYDKTTHNSIPLFLTSRQIHTEAEAILYSHGIFTSPYLPKYDRRLSRFLGGKIRDPASGLSPRLLKLIRHLSFGWSRVGSVRLFSIIGRSMNLDSLELILSEDAVRYINDEWRARAINPRALWRAGYASDFTMQAYARIPRLVIRTPAGAELEGGCLEWWTRGLRRELLSPSGDPKLAWLHVRAERMLSSRAIKVGAGDGKRNGGSGEDGVVGEGESE